MSETTPIKMEVDIKAEMIDYPVATLPEHIVSSSHFKDWLEIFPEETIFPLYNNLFVENLEINCQADFDRIIHTEYVFMFTHDIRIQILKNMYLYWSTNPNSSPITLPNKDKSWFSGQVVTLLSERDSTVAMTCFKRNYVELFDYILERDGLAQVDNGGLYSLYSLPYYGVMNNHIEIVRRGFEVGCSASMDLFDVAIQKKNLEMFKLLIEFNAEYTKKTLIIAAKLGLPEMYEHFLKESRKMNKLDEYVYATLNNLDNLKHLLLGNNNIPFTGNQLLKECVINAHDLETIKFLEKHYEISMQQIRIENDYLCINEAVIKKDDYELYMHLRNNGYEVAESSIVTVMYNKNIRITPGLIKSHYAEDLRRRRMREHDEAFRREREEEDALDRAAEEDEYQLANRDR